MHLGVSNAHRLSLSLLISQVFLEHVVQKLGKKSHEEALF